MVIRFWYKIDLVINSSENYYLVLHESVWVIDALLNTKGCDMISWIVNFKKYNVLYKMSLNKNFDECLNFVNDFIKDYSIFDFMLIWSYSTIFSEDGLTALNL